MGNIYIYIYIVYDRKYIYIYIYCIYICIYTEDSFAKFENAVILRKQRKQQFWECTIWTVGVRVLRDRALKHGACAQNLRRNSLALAALLFWNDSGNACRTPLHTHCVTWNTKGFPRQTLNPVFRSRARSPDLGNAILELFGPIRIDLEQVSAQTVGSGPKSCQLWYMEYNGDLFRHYIRSYWYGVGTKVDDCGTESVEISTKYNPDVIKYRP